MTIEIGTTTMWMLRTALMIALLAPAALAQGKSGKKPAAAPDAAKIDRLLQELGKLDAASWTRKLRALAARAAQHDKRARQLATEIAKHRASAKRIRVEIERIRKLQALVAPKGGASGAKIATKPKASMLAASKKTPPKKTPPKKTPSKKSKPAQAKAAKQKTAKAKTAKAKTAAPSPKKASSQKASSASPRLIDFATHVLPIFEQHCQVCHEAGDAGGGLDLSSFAATMAGGGSGKVIAPGNPEGSRLYRLVARTERPFMPKDSAPISKAELRTLADWIRLGAPADANAAKAAAKRLAARKAKRGTDKRARVVSPMPSWPAMKAATLARPGLPLRALAASPGARALVVACGPELHAYSYTSFGAPLQARAALRTKLARVSALRFSPDGKLLIAGGGQDGRRGHAEVFDVASGKSLRLLGRARDALWAVDLRSDGVAALGGAVRYVELYAADGRRLLRYEHRDWVLALRFSPDGKLLASVDRSGRVLVYEVEKRRELFRYDMAGGASPAIAWRSGKAGRLVVARLDGTVEEVDRRGRRVAQQRLHANMLRGFETTAQGFVSVDRHGALLGGGTSLARRFQRGLESPPGTIAALRVASDRSRAFIVCLDGKLVELELSGKRRKRSHALFRAATADRTGSGTTGERRAISSASCCPASRAWAR